MTLLTLYILVDTIAYHSQFHLTGFMWQLIIGSLTQPVFGFSTLECVFITVVLLGIFFLETVLSLYIWHRIILKNNYPRKEWHVLAIIAGTGYLSLSIIIYSFNYPLAFNQLVNAAAFIPFHHYLIQKVFPIKSNLRYFKKNGSSYVEPLLTSNMKLNYPTQPIQTTPLKHPFNLIIIVIDSWRFDMLNPTITPSIYHFAKHNWQFNQHLSGGNATAPGLFSLFYGLPSTYWDAMEREQRNPVLIEQLLKHHYQMGIYSSGTLAVPDLRNILFGAVPDVEMMAKGSTPYERDIAITHQFYHFITHRDVSRPFFSFLFYDGAHTYCAYDDDLKPLKPTIKNCQRQLLNNNADPAPYFNRYKNALMLVDTQIQHVLNLLEREDLLKNTVVILTGDHGEEFNDTHSNAWGHTSNFTKFQTQTPLVIHWPNQVPHQYTHLTTHYDIVPTLMKDLLGYPLQTKTFAIGHYLHSRDRRPYTIIGGYIDFAIKEPTRLTIIHPDNSFDIQTLDGKPLPRSDLSIPTLREAIGELQRFNATL